VPIHPRLQGGAFSAPAGKPHTVINSAMKITDILNHELIIADLT
jgi:hypothetical protein